MVTRGYFNRRPLSLAVVASIAVVVAIAAAYLYNHYFSRLSNDDDAAAGPGPLPVPPPESEAWSERRPLPTWPEPLLSEPEPEEEQLEEVREPEKVHQEPRPPVVVLEPPRVPPAQARLVEAFESYAQQPTRSWGALLKMGDMYARGAYPAFSPDSETAELCYRAAAMCPDGDVAGLAQMKLLELKIAPIPLEDVKGALLPKQYGERAYGMAIDVIRVTPFADFQTPRFMRKDEPPPPAPQPQPQWTPGPSTPGPRYAGDKKDASPTIDNAGRRAKMTSEQRIAAEMRQREQERRREQERLYKDDAQNVHDHAVTQAIDNNLRQLAGAAPRSIMAVPEAAAAEVDRVRDAILMRDDIGEGIRGQACHVLDTLSTSTHSKFGQSEQQALAVVWNGIEAQRDAATRRNLVETLAKQLASSIENGQVVCSSGKIARIAGTLDGVANRTSVRPLWAVREEIGSLAAKMRDNGDSTEAFERRVRQTYVEELGMSPLILEPVIKEYAEHI